MRGTMMLQKFFKLPGSAHVQPFPMNSIHRPINPFPAVNTLFPLCSPRDILDRSVECEGALAMEWVTPQHEEIDLNCEVSSYANAEL